VDTGPGDSDRAMETGNVTHEELERRRRDLADLMEIVAAEVAKDGGTARLGQVGYADGTVEVVLSGACGSCTLTGATLEDGIGGAVQRPAGPAENTRRRPGRRAEPG